MSAPHRYRLTVLGRFTARLMCHKPAITVNMAAGDEGGHLVHCRTLTMSESEGGPSWPRSGGAWATNVEVDDPAEG